MSGRKPLSLEDNSCYVTETGCLLWEGALNSNGRGQIKIKGVSHRVHRLAYEKAFGEIPADMHVLHKCDVPSCINPDHLYIGTHQDNMRDRHVKFRHAQKLSPDDVKEILSDTSSTQAVLASKYGVDQSLISRIKTNTYWKQIDRENIHG
jgi:hypothetical protein